MKKVKLNNRIAFLLISYQEDDFVFWLEDCCHWGHNSPGTCSGHTGGWRKFIARYNSYAKYPNHEELLNRTVNFYCLLHILIHVYFVLSPQISKMRRPSEVISVLDYLEISHFNQIDHQVSFMARLSVSCLHRVRTMFPDCFYPMKGF